VDKKSKKAWFGDESGVVRECAIACLCGLGVFFLVIVGIYAAGYRLAGLPF
jgi:hypothetical protein